MKTRVGLKYFVNDCISDFTNFKPLLDKLSYKNKNIILLGDFNSELLHY